MSVTRHLNFTLRVCDGEKLGFMVQLFVAQADDYIHPNSSPLKTTFNYVLFEIIRNNEIDGLSLKSEKNLIIPYKSPKVKTQSGKCGFRTEAVNKVIWAGFFILYESTANRIRR